MVSYARYNLGYPPWALDFDPYNRGYLLVGGGGGEGQKEVPNRLTLLDVSKGANIEKVAELDITDDSPVSLGILSAKDGLYAFSGINSGAADRKAGKNEHLRSFKVDYASKTKSEKQSAGKIAQIGQAALFSPSYAKSGDAFQRLLRLSPAKKRASGGKRIGAIASSLAEKSEIVVFDATNASPTSQNIIDRIEPLKNAEANDIDIAEPKEGEFRIAYCTQSEVFLKTISYDFSAHKTKSPLKEATCLHQAPFPDAFASKPGRPRYRSIRFLTSDYLLVLANLGSMSELLILRYYPKGGPGDIVLRKRLPKRMGAAVGLDVCALDADPQTGERQIIIAVAAQAQDISIFTIGHAGKGAPSGFQSFTDLRGAHDAPMKKLVLTPFFSPYALADSSAKNKKVAPQFVRLASISLSNTLIVDDLPLHPVPTKSANPRYVLSKSGTLSRIFQAGSSLFVLAFVLLVSLILVQSVLDACATSGEISNIQLLPKNFRSFVGKFREDNDPVKHIIQEAVDPDSGAQRRLRDLFHLHHDAEKPTTGKAIIIRHSKEDAQLSTEVHHDHGEVVKDETTKRWVELSKDEQDTWKQRLVQAGQWAADEGETVLKGVFFSEVAGAVGRAAVEAIAGGG
jgi:prolactin regulatory element-binding protein